MKNISFGRITAALVLASTLAAAASSAARVTQTPAPAECATARMTLSASAPKAGDELMATVSVSNCSAEKERFVIKYSYTDPCGNTTDMGVAPLKLAAGETQEAKINFLAPASECAGAFKVSAAVVAAGKELTSATATFVAK